MCIGVKWSETLSVSKPGHILGIFIGVLGPNPTPCGAWTSGVLLHALWDLCSSISCIPALVPLFPLWICLKKMTINVGFWNCVLFPLGRQGERSHSC